LVHNKDAAYRRKFDDELRTFYPRSGESAVRHIFRHGRCMVAEGAWIAGIGFGQGLN
jgi:hypothetical protein